MLIAKSPYRITEFCEFSLVKGGVASRLPPEPHDVNDRIRGMALIREMPNQPDGHGVSFALVNRAGQRFLDPIRAPRWHPSGSLIQFRYESQDLKRDDRPRLKREIGGFDIAGRRRDNHITVCEQIHPAPDTPPARGTLFHEAHGPGDNRTVQAIESLIELYETRGDSERAAVWRSKISPP